MKRSSTIRSGRRAFTLAELLVAAAESLALMALVLGFYATTLGTGTSIGNYADMHAAAKIALTRLESDLRPADSVIPDPTDGSVCTPTKVTVRVITSAKSDPLGFFSHTSETVRYSYDVPAKTIVREVLPGGERTVVLRDVDSCLFLYFNRNDVPVSQAGDVKKVVFSAKMSRVNLGRRNTENIVSAVVVLRAQ